MILSIIPKYGIKLSSAGIIQALANQINLKNIAKQDCYQNNNARNPTHKTWLWTLHILGVLMSHSKDDSSVLHNISIFVRQHIDRFLLLL